MERGPLNDEQVSSLVNYLNIKNFRNNPAVNFDLHRQIGLLNEGEEEFIRKGTGYKIYQNFIQWNLRGSEKSRVPDRFYLKQIDFLLSDNIAQYMLHVFRIQITIQENSCLVYNILQNKIIYTKPIIMKAVYFVLYSVYLFHVLYIISV